MSSRRGDWICSQCEYKVFARKDRCPKCQTEKANGIGKSSAIAIHTTEHSSQNSRGGHNARASAAGERREWICPDCKASNYMDRSKCRACNRQRSNEPGNARRGSFGVSTVSTSSSQRDVSHIYANGARHTHTYRDSAREQDDIDSGSDTAFLNKTIRYEHPRINDRATAARFLQAIIRHQEPQEVLQLLTNRREYGKEKLRQALMDHDHYKDPAFVCSNVIPLLQFFSKDDFSRGRHKDSLDELLVSVFLDEVWLGKVHILLQKEKLGEEGGKEAQLLMGWLLLQMVSADEETGRVARKSAETMHPFIQLLHSSMNPACGNLAVQLQGYLHPHASTSAGSSSSTGSRLPQTPLRTLADVLDVPGGRHDNDHEQFRDIQLLPTADEIACKREPYLPTPASVHDQTSMLDRAFRLLRHDFVCSIREEFTSHENANADHRRIFHRAKVAAFVSGLLSEEERLQQAEAGKKNMMIRGVNKGYFEVEFEHSPDKVHHRSTKKFWEDHPRFLQRDALVCFTGANQEPLCFAVVCERNPDDLGSRQPRIGLLPCSAAGCRRMVGMLLRREQWTLVQCQASFFAVEHVLKRLKRIQEIPFSEEIVAWKSGDINYRPDYAANELRYWEAVKNLSSGVPVSEVIKSHQLEKLKSKGGGKLDQSQSMAVLHGLTNRVALIQGPPGTGKSFVGALLTKAIYDLTSETIVCVCYTNHALDQFLIDLLDHGIPADQLVRIGGSDKIDPRLNNMRLRNLTHSQPDTATSRKVIGITKSSIEHAMKELTQFEGRRAKNLLEYLRRHEKEWARRFLVEKRQDKDGMQVVGKKGKAIDQYTLLDLWRQNKTMESTLVKKLLDLNGQSKNMADCQDVWQMKANERQTFVSEWEHGKDGEDIAAYAQRISDLHMEQEKLQSLNNMRDKIAVEGRRIIGLTTSGAAKFHSLLEHVGPGVLVVEEAGEILEQHILTALSSSAKHMILIGDHQQLRPKIDTYELQVGHRNGFDLNRSMFERLVLSDFPYVTLHEQHRMHPSIARLVQALTYPELRTAATVTEQTHPTVKGLQYRLCFVHHTHKEDSHAYVMQNAGAGADGWNKSKINTSEAEMVVRTAIYLLQQGYPSSSIVILTPYLGQCSLIRDKLRQSHYEGELNELDMKELQKAEEMAKMMGHVHASTSDSGAKPSSASACSQPSSSRPRATFRTATIDNFQGEEGDIILVSMVRHNTNGEIGFSGDKERVNVLLSRARHGMLIFGNADTLCKKPRSQWRKVFKVTTGAANDGPEPLALPVQTGVPIVCQRHPDQRMVIRSPQEFMDHAPEGGCRRTCHVAIACGLHQCERLCHIVTPQCHSADRCRIERSVQCNLGRHIITLPCYQTQIGTNMAKEGVGCKECKKERLKFERKQQEQQARIQQLDMELHKAQVNLELELQHQKHLAEVRLKEEMIKVANEQGELAIGVLKQQLQNHHKNIIDGKKKEYADYIHDVKKKLAIQKDEAAQIAKSAPPSALVVHTSSPVSILPSIPQKLLSDLQPTSTAFKDVKVHFMESFAKMPAHADLSFHLRAVQQVHNPKLEKLYAQAWQQRKDEGHPDGHESLVYHGTRESNILSIVNNNLSMSKKGQLDSGWFGAGLYFSPHADYCFMYAKQLQPLLMGTCFKILQFAILPGRINQLSGLQHGQPKHPNFDSNRSTNGYEFILFDSKYCLPKHVLEVEVKAAPGAKFNGSHEQKGK